MHPWPTVRGNSWAMRDSLARRNARTDDRPVALLPQDARQPVDRAGQYRHRHAYHGVLHPTGQPDELRDYRQGYERRAFIFEQVDHSPRHPGQLYEAIAYAVFFFIGWYLYRKHAEKVGTGFFRPLPHADIHLPLLHRIHQRHSGGIRIGHAAGYGTDFSIPFIIIGVACMIGGNWMKKVGAK